MSKERPILFSGEMVRAILDGRKTQTRRVIKAPPTGTVFPPSIWNGQTWYFRDGYYADPDHDIGRYVKCPYGKPGDHLWVKEAWNIERRRLQRARDSYLIDYAADTGLPILTPTEHPDAAKYANNLPGWRSPIFMPRWVSRITMEVTSVRVERVQEISEEDAVAEGIINHLGDPYPARDYFMDLWNKINAKRGYSWESNPFVWVLSFERIEVTR